MNIIFYIGNTWEQWDPESIEKNGSGGSEIAVVELTKNFAKLGHNVTVYGDPVTEKIYDNVTYLHHSRFNNLTCDLLIAYRTPWAVDSGFNVNYKYSILWMQDTHMGDSINLERYNKLDKIFVLSQWHNDFLKSFYPFITDDKLQLVTNGLNLKYFDKQIKRNPYKAFYSSSPSRDLSNLCFIWNSIIKEIPSAELHIYYGFDVWKLAAKNNLQELNKIHSLEATIKHTPNTYMHGRISAQKLAEEQLSCGVWTYPTNFHETSCITAMEAHAAGCRIITSDIGALTNTVKHGVLIKGNAYSKEYHDLFIKYTIEAMQNLDNSDRLIAQESVKMLDWQIVANKCHELFLNL